VGKFPTEKEKSIKRGSVDGTEASSNAVTGGASAQT
jgi:hypothetical protein